MDSSQARIHYTDECRETESDRVLQVNPRRQSTSSSLDSSDRRMAAANVARMPSDLMCKAKRCCQILLRGLTAGCVSARHNSKSSSTSDLTFSSLHSSWTRAGWCFSAWGTHRNPQCFKMSILNNNNKKNSLIVWCTLNLLSYLYLGKTHIKLYSFIIFLACRLDKISK